MRVVQIIVVDVASHTRSPCRPWGSSQLGENAVPSAAVDTPSTNLVVVVDGTHSGLIVRGRPLVDEVSGLVTISQSHPVGFGTIKDYFLQCEVFLTNTQPRYASVVPVPANTCKCPFAN